MEIVDCSLPGQMRMLGNRPYMTQRQPIRTVASDCRQRGGEYVAYDRANLETALRVWLEAAEQGDTEAQVNVGEIYERGLGTGPDHATAGEWYQKAIDGCSDKPAGKCDAARAKFNLATLYERGLGVEQDKLKALNLYRESWGIKDNNLLYQDAVERQVAELRAELEQAIAERDSQIDVLEKQIQDLEADLKEEAARSGEVATLRGLVAKLRKERESNEVRLVALPQATTREPGAARPVTPIETNVPARAIAGLNLGRYFALLIGNQEYQAIESLATPHRDTERAAAVLRDKYGFSVQIIKDADDVAMMRALYDLNAVLKPEDNLLIYYAGHGERLQSAVREDGFWLPVNADPPPKDAFWVPNEQVTAHLARLPARRVLVVADSCYAGLLSNDPSSLFLRDPGQVTVEYIRYKLANRSRLLISSGGDQPVLDQGGAGNSVFARALLEVLEANEGVLSTPALFVRLQARLKQAAVRTGFTQVPEYKAIKSAGHTSGDFFFVPVRN